MTAFRQPCRLTIYLCDSAAFQHKALSDVIVRRAHDGGLSGATVLRGVEGFGRSGDVHTTRILDISDHLPMAVVIVDEDSKLRDFVHRNDDCLHGRLTTLEPLEVFTAGAESAAPPSPRNPIDA